MAYVSFTLKYRPNTFADVVGQDHVTRTLRNAVAAGRINHAYLFSGPRGTGKTSVARVLAKALNCESGPTPDPCGTCGACSSITEGRALDIVEIDAASNRGIDEIRDLREKVKYSPAESRHKVYILDEVHMLTTEAFNALLKTLEEPPAHAYFILATTEPHRVPATIISRCQRFDFRRIGVPDISQALQGIAEAEGIEAEPEALAALARAADGGMRDSQSILDQLVAYAGEKVDVATVNTVLGATDLQTLTEIIAAVLSGEHRTICEIVDRLVSEGKDLGQLLDDLMLYARDMARLALNVEPIGPVAGSPDDLALQEQAKALGASRAMALMTHFAEVRQEFRRSTQHALLLETALLEAARPEPVSAPRPVPAPAQQPAAPAAVVAPTPQPTTLPAPPAPRRPEPTRPVAPQAAEASTPQPQAPGEALTLEAVQGGWGHVSAALRQMGRAPAVALLREGQPTSVAGRAITITFPPNYKFHHSKVAGEYKDVVEQAAAQVFGGPLTVDAVLTDDIGAPPPGPPAASAPTPQAQPTPAPTTPGPSPPAAVEQVQDVFPGSQVKDDGPPGGAE